jgi:hypothetical protein
VLHITNGDCAVSVLQAAAMRGEILPWRDALHEGPVPAGLALEELSTRRIRFIADAGWGAPAEVAKSFRERDAAFRRAGEHDEIVLWFEHDLYDQLQLIQVLDGLYGQPRVSLVCEAEYLGSMAPERAAELFALRSPVTKRHYNEAREAWSAFRSADPMAINSEFHTFPFLGAALTRLLEEYPWTTDGLSRLQRDLDAKEEPVFLGDTVREWLRKRRDEGRWLPRWLGGVLVTADSPWRWDPAARRLSASPPAR